VTAAVVAFVYSAAARKKEEGDGNVAVVAFFTALQRYSAT